MKFRQFIDEMILVTEKSGYEYEKFMMDDGWKYVFLDGPNEYEVVIVYDGSPSILNDTASIVMAVTDRYDPGKGSYEKPWQVENPRKVFNTRVEIIKDFLKSNRQILKINSDPIDPHRKKLWSIAFQKAGMKVIEDEGVITASRKRIVAEIRSDWRRQLGESSSQHHFWEFPPPNDIKQIVDNNQPSCKMGDLACQDMSEEWAKIFDAHGVHYEIHDGFYNDEGHTWLVINGVGIFDPTAAQFDDFPNIDTDLYTTIDMWDSIEERNEWY